MADRHTAAMYDDPICKKAQKKGHAEFLGLTSVFGPTLNTRS